MKTVLTLTGFTIAGSICMLLGALASGCIPNKGAHYTFYPVLAFTRHKIHLAMPKQDVQKIMDQNPGKYISIINKNGQLIELAEYLFVESQKGNLPGGTHIPYWFYFRDGKLAKWRKAGRTEWSWWREEKKIYEMEFE